MGYGKVRFFDFYILKPFTAVCLALGVRSFANRLWIEGGLFILAAVVTLLVTRNLSDRSVDRAALTAPSYDTTGMDFEGYIIAKNAIFASFPIGVAAFILSWQIGYRYMAALAGIGAMVSFPALVSTVTAHMHKLKRPAG